MRPALISYYTTVAALAVILACNGGAVNLTAAALVCLGARPLLREIERSTIRKALKRARRHLVDRTR